MFNLYEVDPEGIFNLYEVDPEGIFNSEEGCSDEEDEEGPFVYSVFYSNSMFRQDDEIVGIFDSLEKAEKAIENILSRPKKIDHPYVKHSRSYYKIEKHKMNMFDHRRD